MAFEEFPVPNRILEGQLAPEISCAPQRTIADRTRDSLRESLTPSATFAKSLIEFCQSESVTLSDRRLSDAEILAMISGAKRTIARQEKQHGGDITEDEMSTLMHGVAGEGVLHALLRDYSDKNTDGGMQMLCDNTPGTYAVGQGEIWIPENDPYNVVFLKCNHGERDIECDAVMVNDNGSRMYALDVTTSRYTLAQKLETDRDTKANMIHRLVQQPGNERLQELETHFFHVLLTNRSEALECPYEAAYDRVSVIRLPFHHAAKNFGISLQVWEKAHRSNELSIMRQCFRHGSADLHSKHTPSRRTRERNDVRSQFQQP